jgi:hypothetical protein
MGVAFSSFGRSEPVQQREVVDAASSEEDLESEDV